MTQDDIIRMAIEAGAGQHEGYEVPYVTFNPDALERFVKLVTAKKDQEIQDLTNSVLEFIERME